MKIRYTARRSLLPTSPTHVVGTVYEIDPIKLSKLQRTSKVDRRDVRSLSGALFSTFRDVRNEWKLTTAAITYPEIYDWREFVDSCVAAEAFEIDFDDGQGYRSVQLLGKTVAEKRVAQRGGTGALTDYFVLGFTVREK